jgi:hypothetical protein
MIQSEKDRPLRAAYFSLGSARAFLCGIESGLFEKLLPITHRFTISVRAEQIEHLSVDDVMGVGR